MKNARSQPPDLIQGQGAHRRTEDAYMGALLDAVTLDDWREVVATALQMAKQGDAQARAWLAQYLVGKPQVTAPTPMAVVVNRFDGRDPVAERLAKPIIDRAKFPTLHEDDEWEAEVRAAVAAELEANTARD